MVEMSGATDSECSGSFHAFGGNEQAWKWLLLLSHADLVLDVKVAKDTSVLVPLLVLFCLWADV